MTEPSTETQSFFENVRQLDAHRPDVERVQLFTALAGALEKSGHLRLVNATAQQPSGDLTGLAIPVLFWGLGGALGYVLDQPWPIWLALGVAILIAYGIVATKAPTVAGPIGGGLIVAWVGSGVALAVTSPADLLLTHGFPVAVALVLGFALRSLHLREARDIVFALGGVGRSVPFLAPVVLVAILLPALTADVWELAAAIETTNVGAAAVVSVGLLLLVVTRQLRRELEPAFVARCRTLKERAVAHEHTRSALLSAVDSETARIIEELPSERIAEAWSGASEAHAPYLVAVEGRSLRRPLAVRLALTTVTVGALLAAYIYVLLSVTVPRTVAAKWTGSRIEVSELIGTGILAPEGAYIAMAVLLGIFATAIFLAFALTEESVAAALTEALLRDPLDRFLLLALPFVALVEWGMDVGEVQIGAESSEVSSSEEGGGDETR